MLQALDIDVHLASMINRFGMLSVAIHLKRPIDLFRLM